MAPTVVSEQEILEALRRVPAEQWDVVLRLLEALAKASTPTIPERRLLTGADLLTSGLVGMWADRTDIGDSRDFARQLREKAQRRRRER
jgi:hypothetical protein